MQYTAFYQSPLGEMLLAADEKGLTGLWFCGAKYYAGSLAPEHEQRRIPVLEMTEKWLDIYFSGRRPDFSPPVHMEGSPFRLAVWEKLRQIPYGETRTYGELARMLAEEKGLSGMSAQAVGGAVGHNPISVLIPCHRVVGSDGSLRGYAGGIEKKVRLLALEGIRIEK